jgi:prepilin peptidase CpaA
MDPALLKSLALVVVLVVAAISDVRTRRIPNSLVLGGLAVALLARVPDGLSGTALGAAGAGVGLVIGLALFALGALGGGDGKLLMVVGAFFGPVQFLGALLAIAIAGGVLAVAMAIAGGTILPAMLSTGRLLRYLLTFGRGGELRTLESSGAQRIPYGVAIAAGSLAWWFWGGQL